MYSKENATLDHDFSYKEGRKFRYCWKADFL